MLQATIQPDPRIARMIASCEMEGIAYTISPGERLQRGRDDTYLPPAAADIVVFATSTADVVAVVSLCSELDLPLIAFGAGTGTEGHVMALKGGVCLDMTRMNSVLSLSTDDFECTIQAGMTRRELNEYLRDTGMFFPIDACPEASIGGMASTRASGTNAVRYGTMRENIVSMEVVMADGSVIRTGRNVRKSAAGYDLTRLFVGSAGTLGIITELTVRLHGIPETTVSATCSFETVQAAASAVQGITMMGLPVGKVEIIDAVAATMINAYSKTNFKPATQLFLEFSGIPTAVAEYADLAESVCSDHGGSAFSRATAAAEQAAMWSARHNVWYAALMARPGCKGWPTDITVPVSRLAEAISDTRADLDDLPFPAPIVGHVGDGNFHVILLIDLDDPEEVRLAKAVNDRMVERALQLGGTCTGEHGVGYAKNRWLLQEFGAGGMAVMHKIKDALDPKGILNPGKIFDVGEADSDG